MIGEEPDRLIKELAVRIKKKKKDLTTSESEAITRQAVAWLLKIVSMAFIEKAGMHLSSDDLRDNVDDVVGANSTLAMRMIKIGQQLSTPNRLPQAAVKSLIKNERDNPCVMSVLQLIILKRLYMYETEHDDKDWAISTFQLSGSSQPIEFSNRQKRLEKRDRT